ncbi:MAG: hypothetical protein AB7F40_11390 [Victivallaceae bacterium]
MDENNTLMVAGGVKPLSLAQITEQVQTIQQVLHKLMKPRTHYDSLPGCGDKKVLLKPGAELILTTFRLAVEPQITEIREGDDIRYRIITRGFHIPTGNTVGFGVGECSTAEKKYKWRASVCDEEFEATPETKRQTAWLKDKNGKIRAVPQVRQNIEDILNTVLKMAKKRSLVDFCLNATACSDLFVQDLEDGDTPPDNGGSHYQPPREKSAPNPPIEQQLGDTVTEAQAKRAYAMAKGAGLSNDGIRDILWEMAGVERTRDIPAEKYDEICAALEAGGARSDAE